MGDGGETRLAARRPRGKARGEAQHHSRSGGGAGWAWPHCSHSSLLPWLRALPVASQLGPQASTGFQAPIPYQAATELDKP